VFGVRLLQAQDIGAQTQELRAHRLDAPRQRGIVIPTTEVFQVHGRKPKHGTEFTRRRAA
jgi:hypothetical protein